MPYDPELHGRRSIRLPGFDYKQGGMYFVTICSNNRECLFGEVEGFAVRLSKLGQVVRESWQAIPDHYKDLQLDLFVVMPNHLHGLLQLNGDDETSPTLGSVIGAFKAITSKRARDLELITSKTLWQRNYYEHIIRNEKGLERLREYIVANPEQWQVDELNPSNF